MANETLRYTIEVDASKATPELRKFLAQFGATLKGVSGDVDTADKRLEASFSKFDKTMSNLEASLTRLKATRAGNALTQQGDAVAVQLPLWQRLAIGVTGVNQALSLLDRTAGRALRSIIGQFEGVVAQGERLVTLSQRFGIPVEAIGKLDFVARRAGVSFEGMGQGIRLFAVQLEQAKSGQAEAVRLFQALGIEGDGLRKLASQGLLPAFIATAQKLGAVTDQTRQAAIGTRLFRGAWDELKIVLANTNGDIAGAAKRAEELHGILSEQLTNSAQKVTNAFFDLRTAILGLFARLSEQGVFDAIARSVDKISTAIANIPQEDVVRLGKAFRDLAASFSDAAPTAIEHVVAAVTTLLEKLHEVGAYLETHGTLAMLFNPIGSTAGIFGQLFGAPAKALVTGQAPGGAAPTSFAPGSTHGGTGTLSDLRAFINGTQNGSEPPLFGSSSTAQLDKYKTAVQQLRDKLQEVSDTYAVLTETGDKSALAGDRIRAELTRLAAEAKTNVAPEIQKLIDEFVKMSQAVQELQFDRTSLQPLRDQFELLQAQAAGASKATQDAIALQFKLRDAARAGATPAQVQEFAGLQQSIDALNRFKAGAFDVFDAIGSAADTMFDGLARGTLKMSDVFQSLKVGIIRSFVDAFKQGFAEKLGFENKFQINIAQFVKNISGMLTGSDGSTGLFGGVFAPLTAAANKMNGGGQTPYYIAAPQPTAPYYISNPSIPATNPDTGVPDFVSPLTASANKPAGKGFTAADLIAIVGAMVAIAEAFKSIGEDAQRIDKAAMGVGNAAKNFQAISYASTAALTAGLAGAGAAIGTVVPGIGNIVGAALGAAVGAAISSAISSEISKSIAAGTKGAISGGLTQGQLNNTVGKDLLLTILSGGNSRSEVGRENFLFGIINLMIPKIEDIFDKIFKETLRHAGLVTAGLGHGGEGVHGGPGLGLGDTAFQLSRVIGGAIGAGDLKDRGRRFADIFLTGAIEQAQRSGKDVSDVLFRVFRTVFEGSFADAFRIVYKLDSGRPKAQARVVEAFNAGAPQADFGVVANVLNAQADRAGRFFGAGTGKKAIDASREAFAGFLGGDTLGQFGTQLAGVVKKAFSDGMTDALATAFAPALLGGIFQVSRQAAKQLKKGNLDVLPGIASQFNQAASDTLTLLSQGGLAGTLGEIAHSFDKAQKAIDLFGIAVAAASGDTTQLREAIEGVIAAQLKALKDFRDFIHSVAVRTAALQNNPFGALTEQRNQAGLSYIQTLTATPAKLTLPANSPASDVFDFLKLFAKFRQAIEALKAAGSQLPEFEALQQLFEEGAPNIEKFASSLALFNSLPLDQQVSTVRDLYESSLNYLEAEVELQNARIQFYGQAKKAFQDLIDQVSTIRYGRFGQKGIFDRLSAELPQLTQDLQSTDEATRTNAITRLQEIGPQLIQLASQLFAPGSAALTSFLDMITPILDQAFSTSASQEADAVARKAAAQEQAQEIYDLFQPILSDLETQLQTQVGDSLLDIYNILAGEGDTGLLGVLKAIATSNAIGVTFPEHRAAGGPVMSGSPYMVGERGAELFVPSTDGYIVPNPDRMPSVLNVSIGDVDVQVHSALSDTAITNAVADALMRNLNPRLTRGVQVALGAR